MKWALVLLFVAVGLVVWQFANRRDPSIPTVPAAAGASPMVRAPGEPVEGEANIHDLQGR